METFQKIGKSSIHSENFAEYVVTCQKIWKLSRHSILSRLYEKLFDKTETFETIQKGSRQSGNFSDDPETFRKLQWFSRQVQGIIDKSMFIAKLSGCAQIYWGSMLPHSLCIFVSGTMGTFLLYNHAILQYIVEFKTYLEGIINFSFLAQTV